MVLRTGKISIVLYTKMVTYEWLFYFPLMFHKDKNITSLRKIFWEKIKDTTNYCLWSSVGLFFLVNKMAPLRREKPMVHLPSLQPVPRCCLWTQTKPWRTSTEGGWFFKLKQNSSKLRFHFQNSREFLWWKLYHFNIYKAYVVIEHKK